MKLAIRALDLVSRIGGGGEETVEKTSAVDLARPDTVAGDLGHAGEMLDAQAKADHKRRLTELEDEIEEAREFKDEERIAKAEGEKKRLAENTEARLDSLGAIGGRLIQHARYHWLLLAESHLTPRLFGNMLQKIAALPSPAG
jgi:hypothetical protein